MARALTELIGFLVTPIVLGFLGAEKYGVWVIIGTLLGYFGLLDLEVTSTGEIVWEFLNPDISDTGLRGAIFRMTALEQTPKWLQ